MRFRLVGGSQDGEWHMTRDNEKPKAKLYFAKAAQFSRGAIVDAQSMQYANDWPLPPPEVYTLTVVNAVPLYVADSVPTTADVMHRLIAGYKPCA